MEIQNTHDHCDFISLFDRVADTSDHLISRFLPDGTLIYVNKKTLDVFRLTREQCIGRNATNYMTPDGADQFREGILALSKNKRMFIREQAFVVGGKSIVVRWENRKLYCDFENIFIGYVGIGEVVRSGEA